LRGKPVDHIEDLHAMEQGIPGSLDSSNLTTRAANEPGAHGTWLPGYRQARVRKGF
jgi:hypothetical protein